MGALPSPAMTAARGYRRNPERNEGRGGAGKAKRGLSLELVFGDSPRSIVAMGVKQPQGCDRPPVTQSFLPDFRDLELFFHGLK